MSTPDITLAQIISALTALAAAGVVLFKLDLSDAQRAALTTVITTLVTLGWFIADALIRRARAQHAAAAATTTVTTATPIPTTPASSAAAAPVISVTTATEPAARAPRRKKNTP